MERQHHNPLLKLLLILAGFFIGNVLFAQQTNRIVVDHADAFNYNAKLGKDIQQLIGHVRMHQVGTLFFSDSAYLSEQKRNFDAFSQVHIIVNDTVNLYGDRLHYEGKTRIAELFGNVILKDKKTTLYTNHLIYNRNTEIAHYDQGGRILSDSNVLRSQLGYYDTKTRIFYFQKHVVVNSREDTLQSDTLIYNTNSAVAYIKGPTQIRGKETTIHCSRGWFDTQNDDSKLFDRPRIQSKSETLTADSVIYSNHSTHGKAYGNIQIVDTSRQIVIEGQISEMWNKTGISYITNRAMAISYDQQDSLFMHADTLWMFLDKHRKAKTMLAYHQVRFFRKDLQGTCDSLAYTMQDSTMRMFHNPVIWSGDNQLTSDTISLVMKNGQMDTMSMTNNAFIVSLDSTQMFNQIKGRTMVGYFRRNRIYQMKVDGNAQSIYWLRSENKQLIGLNKAEASDMMIKIRDNKIVGIDYLDKPSETLYPPKGASGKTTILDGFHWLNYLRPVTKADIFKKIKRKESPDQNTENFK